MAALTTQTPEFDRPPVIEVALSVQFKRLDQLRSAHIGLLWSRFRKRFPRTEDHGPLQPAFETFDRKPTQLQLGVEVQTYDVPPLPRAWFLNETGTELVQVQPDRFIRNWRKVGETDEYVRYAHIKGKFVDDLREFEQFVADQGVGDVSPNQCEVTYVNHIVSGEGWSTHGDLGKIFRPWSGSA